jgi:hypothetical protein
MTKTHKDKIKPTVKWNTKVLPNLDNNGLESNLSGWSAADVDKGESLEEMAIVKLLGSLRGLKNSHAGFRSTGHAIEHHGVTLLLTMSENRIQKPCKQRRITPVIFLMAL